MSDLNWKKFLNTLAFIAIMCIAVALLLQVLLKDMSGSVIYAVRLVGECMAYLITIFIAFGFVRNKRSNIWAILYAIAVTAIVVLVILR